MQIYVMPPEEGTVPSYPKTVTIYPTGKITADGKPQMFDCEDYKKTRASMRIIKYKIVE